MVSVMLYVLCCPVNGSVCFVCCVFEGVCEFAICMGVCYFVVVCGLRGSIGLAMYGLPYNVCAVPMVPVSV